MPSDRLDQSSQVGPSDTKHKGPVVLWIKVRVSQNEEALVTLWLQFVPHDDIEQVLCFELLPACVWSCPNLDQSLLFEILEV